MKNKILSASQTKMADQFTIENDQISSIDLMEKAGNQFVNAIIPFVHGKPLIHIFCGKGSNGGDGFAVARLLKEKGALVHTYLLDSGQKLSKDCEINASCLKQYKIIDSENNFPKIKAEDVVIDALLGAGLTRRPEGLLAALIEFLNHSKAKILSIDIPSGLSCDELPANSSIIKAHFTGTFEFPKKSFFMKESAKFLGKWQVLPIGLNQPFIQSQASDLYYLTQDFFKEIILPREKFTNKGTYGHGLLIAGSKGKMGSAILSAKAALRSGIGLLTAQIPSCGYVIFQSAVPEAMCETDDSIDFNTKLKVDFKNFNAIGVGPGMGNQIGTKNILTEIFTKSNLPLVIDADALNVISEYSDLQMNLPANSILTPHPKEFERLAGKSKNSFERLELLRNFARKTDCYIVLKDAITTIACPDGKIFFNTTGNPGMATGGSGDVLTGIILGLLAQGFSPLNATLIGVYFHGKAGDLASIHVGENQIIASDLVQYFRLM
jgi:NAD(P)H-hydrate epimerase